MIQVAFKSQAEQSTVQYKLCLWEHWYKENPCSRSKGPGIKFQLNI